MSDPGIEKRLSAAVAAGRLSRVEELINRHGLIDLRDGGYSLLCQAVHRQHSDITKLLIVRGAAVTRPPSEVPFQDPNTTMYNSPLLGACANGDLDIVEMLLERGADINSDGKDGQTPLHNAIKHRHVALAKFLLERNADPCALDNNNFRTPLHVAAEKGCAIIVEFLLQYGVSVNCAGKDGNKALHLAAECGSWHVTKLLLKKGAEVGAKNGKKQTPLHVAAHKANVRIAELLFEAGASISDVCKDQFTPLHYAVASGVPDIVAFLLNKDVKVDEAEKCSPVLVRKRRHYNYDDDDDDEDNYYMVAHERHGYSCIPHVPLNKKFTPLHIASKLGHAKIAELLLEKGADIHALTDDKTTPLLIATKGRLVSVMKLLLQKGAKVDDGDRSALLVAVETGSLEVVQEILNHHPEIDNTYNESCIRKVVCSPDMPLQIKNKYGNSATFERKGGEILKALFSYGFSVNKGDAKDSAFFRAAVSKGYLEVVEDLLKNGADVDDFTDCDYSVCSGDLDEEEVIPSLSEQIELSDPPLKQVVKDINVEMAKLLIRYKANVNIKDMEGKTPLFYIFTLNELTKRTKNNLFRKQKELAELLIGSGSDVNAQDNDQKTVLFYAVIESKLEVVRFLLRNKADVNIKDDSGKTPIFYASEFQISELLMKNSAEINIQDNNGETLIFSAVQLSNFEMIKFLIENNTNVNAKDSAENLPTIEKADSDVSSKILVKTYINFDLTNKTGKSPVYFAVKNNNFQITKLLLDHGFNIKNIPPLLMEASKAKCTDIVKLLIDYGADVNERDEDNNTAIHQALFTSFRNYIYLDSDAESLDGYSDYKSGGDIKEKIVEILLSQGADVEAQTNDGTRALHFAVHAGSVDAVKILLKYNADVNCVTSVGAGGTKKNVTPLHLCAAQGNVEICSILLKQGAEVNAKQSDGQTALHVACWMKKRDIVMTLLDNGADVNAKEVSGKTALYIACEMDMRDADFIMRLLKRNITHADMYLLTAAKITKLFETLLDYGADIDVIPPFTGYCALSPTSSTVLRRYIFKLNVANLPIPNQYVSLLRDTQISDEADYRYTCEEELARMMSEQIKHTNITFYDILTKSCETLAKLVRNEDIMRVVMSEQCRRKYPVYVGPMLKQIQIGVNINSQREGAAFVLQSLFSQLPLDCVQKIMHYLSEQEMKVYC